MSNPVYEGDSTRRQAPVTAGSPTRYRDEGQYAPAPRRTAPAKTKVPSNAPAWIQAISIAAVSAIIVLMFILGVGQYIKLKAAMWQAQQQYSQSQNCGVNPNTGLVECR